MLDVRAIPVAQMIAVGIVLQQVEIDADDTLGTIVSRASHLALQMFQLSLQLINGEQGLGVDELVEVEWRVERGEWREERGERRVKNLSK